MNDARMVMNFVHVGHHMNDALNGHFVHEGHHMNDDHA